MKPYAAIAVVLGLIALTVGLPAAPAAPAKDKETKDAKDDIKKFEGEWTFTNWETGGQSLPKEVLEITKWSVKGDKYKFQMGENEEEGTIKLDPGKKPATVDLAITSGNDAGKDQVGIYKFDGESIVICLARPGAKDRPTEFKATEDDGQILVTIKRNKKDD
jgi:uncharacterized protein (TIGR03067 family)